MPSSSKVREYIRSNVLGFVAIFIALAGSAWAGTQIGSKDIDRNAVRSKHIKAGNVRAPDVDPSQVQLRIAGACAPGQTIQAVNEDGTVACEGGGSASDLACVGCVGNGDLGSGAVSIPKLAFDPATQAELDAQGGDLPCAGCVGTGDIADGAVSIPKLAFDPATQAELDAQAGNLACAGCVGTGDLADSAVSIPKLAFDPATQAELDAHGATLDAGSGFVSFCDPNSATFVACDPAGGPVTIDVPAGTQVLLNVAYRYYVATYDGAGADATGAAQLSCRPLDNGATISPVATISLDHASAGGDNVNGDDRGSRQGMPFTWVTGPLSGTHAFTIECAELDGDMRIEGTTLSAVALGS